MALIDTEIVIKMLEARLRLHLWQSNENTLTQFLGMWGIHCAGTWEFMQNPEDRCFYLFHVQLRRGWPRKWFVVIYPFQLAQPQSFLHVTSLALQSPYSLLSSPNIYEIYHFIQHKFKERFYNASFGIDLGSDWRTLHALGSGMESSSWLCLMRQPLKIKI